MLTITNIELGGHYPTGDYKLRVYRTVVELNLGESYNRAKVTLSDEQTDRIVEFIRNMIGGSIAVGVSGPTREEVEEAIRRERETPTPSQEPEAPTIYEHSHDTSALSVEA